MGLDLGVFLVRAAATAGIVIAITLAVGRLGARRGGVLAGLPIVLGPGFVVLAATEPDAYVAEAATYALLSLTATQAFMLAYSGVARAGVGVAAALAGAVLAWLACAAVFTQVEAGAVGALLAFLAATALSHAAHRRLALVETPVRGRDGPALLLMRGTLAGALVGAVTAASSWLGPALAGLAMAYPVGMTVIAATIHRRHGAPTAIATLGAVAIGTGSLAAFCLAIAVLALPLGAGIATATGLAGAMATTAVLFRASRARAPPADERPRR
ncbi:hypothetical protein [Salinarimonas sp.]|uniref:hypothetical protein n=1 Tax=Salinarimonas sp. TaxID=2766526 RepID=UPI0032D98878